MKGANKDSSLSSAPRSSSSCCCWPSAWEPGSPMVAGGSCILGVHGALPDRLGLTSVRQKLWPSCRLPRHKEVVPLQAPGRCFSPKALTGKMWRWER